jgi:hypothetical protein
MFMDSPANRVIDTESCCPWRGNNSIAGSSELAVFCRTEDAFTSRMYQRNLPTEFAFRLTEVLLMALTFGTLLSSQGADAHRRNRFRLFGGNPRNATPVRVVGSNPLPPGFPLGRRSPGSKSSSVARRAWGMSLRLPRGLRAANKENISQPQQAESNSLGRPTGCP